MLKKKYQHGLCPIYLSPALASGIAEVTIFKLVVPNLISGTCVS